MVRAAGEAVILCIDKKGLFAKISKDPSPTFNIIERMSKKIRSLSVVLQQHNKGK